MRWKSRVGCSVGCLTLILLAVGSCVGFTLWLDRPGTLVEPARLTGASSVGVVNWTLRLEDPGTLRFVTGAIERLEDERDRNLARHLPPAVRALARMGDRVRDAKMRAMFPIEAGLVVESAADPAAEPSWLGYLSFQAGGNRIRMAGWVMGFVLRFVHDDPTLTYRGERILPLADEGQDREDAGAVLLHGNDVFVASRLALARGLIDRLAAGPPERRPPTSLDPLLARVSQERAIRGALLNRRGEIGALLEPWLARRPAARPVVQLLDAAGPLTIEGGFEPDGALVLDVGFDCADPACAEWSGRNLESPVLTLAATGQRATLRVRLADPLQALAAALAPPESGTVRPLVQ